MFIVSPDFKGFDLKWFSSFWMVAWSVKQKERAETTSRNEEQKGGAMSRSRK